MTSRRREFPKAVKLAAWERCAGHCEECTANLSAGWFHYDHEIADALGGEPTIENCRVLCRNCHSDKTDRHDKPTIAKAKRCEARHIGAKTPSRRPVPGSRASGLRRRMDGTVERR